MEEKDNDCVVYLLQPGASVPVLVFGGALWRAVGLPEFALWEQGICPCTFPYVPRQQLFFREESLAVASDLISQRGEGACSGRRFIRRKRSGTREKRRPRNERSIRSGTTPEDTREARSSTRCCCPIGAVRRIRSSAEKDREKIARRREESLRRANSGEGNASLFISSGCTPDRCRRRGPPEAGPQ